jgi:uncharacterized protein
MARTAQGGCAPATIVAEPAAQDREPVTAVFTWAVTPGRETDFEDWLRAIDTEAATFPGQQGVTWLRPEGESHRYYAVLRFSDSQSLGNWTASPQRTAQIRRLQGIAVEEEPRLTTTGLETWFSLPRQAVRPPPRWKMTIVTFIGFSGKRARAGLAPWKNPLSVDS